MVMAKKSTAKLVAIAMACLVLGTSAELATKNNPAVSYGLFMIGSQEVAMVTKSDNGCILPDQPCGLLHHCCEGLGCTGLFNGRCVNLGYCQPKVGGECALLGPCCYPMKCSQTTMGGKCLAGSSYDLLAGAYNAAAAMKEVVSTAEE